MCSGSQKWCERHRMQHMTTEKTFDKLVNMSASEISDWLKTDESKKVGFRYPGQKESVGRKSARKIIRILDGDNKDEQHMRKVIGYIKRHKAQKPKGSVRETRWRYSLMNWGHDPLGLGHL